MSAGWTTCPRCLYSEQVVNCLECERSFCEDCDADDLNECENSGEKVCASCLNDHEEWCHWCRVLNAQDRKSQEQEDYLQQEGE